MVGCVLSLNLMQMVSNVQMRMEINTRVADPVGPYSDPDPVGL